MTLRALRFAVACLALGLSGLTPAHAEDGYDLWLRYPEQPPDRAQEIGNAFAMGIVGSRDASDTIRLAMRELVSALESMGSPPVVEPGRMGFGVVLGTPQTSRQIRGLGLDLGALGPEGYLIQTHVLFGRPTTVITANTDIGVLYGVFAFARLMQTGADLTDLDIVSVPAIQHRVIDHWDDLDGHVERGYAGASLWDWDALPETVSPRMADYARAQASIGVNGVSLVNVNADSQVLTPAYLEKVAALADTFRPYGIAVYLTARFSAPIEFGGLHTADPLDPDVAAWWAAKADEIYGAIPDFGGFLVKANSEGQPGPQDYARSHADGANMLADAVAPHGGVVMWRAFVYSAEDDEDRAKQAYSQFVPLDGTFRDNVLIQVKNGPIDFQPREPFHPMFGAMPDTPLMAELQITKEYLGFNTHLAYLAPLWEEVLDADTHADGDGATVARVIDGSLDGHALSGVAGVANTGTDRNWSGSIFDQANWYAFGRLAWDPELDSRTIAEDWARMTFGNDPDVVATVVDMMMSSREAVVDYMTPLGLAHQMATGHHYGPGPWVCDLSRPEWNPCYYHRADAGGIGFDRTASGSDALSQYAPYWQAAWGDPETIPEDLLLWFHHIPWSFEMESGRTLWDEMVRRYDRGVRKVAAMREAWAGLEGKIDAERYAAIAEHLAIQQDEAKWWRDASIAYFQSLNGLPLPAGAAAPEHDLEHYKSLSFPDAPG